jgi:hypothetical protein
MRLAAASILVVATVVLAACPNVQTPSSSAVTPFKVKHLPPRPKDAIDALLASSQVPLSVDSTCQGVGTEQSDATIGRYLSGFLAELSDPKASNAIETSIAAQKLPSGEDVWVCKIMIRHALGEDLWRWGVEFAVQQKDGAVKTDSFRCLGSG